MRTHTAAFLTAMLSMLFAAPSVRAQSIPTAAHDLTRGSTLTAADILWTSPAETPKGSSPAAADAAWHTSTHAPTHDTVTDSKVGPGWIVRRAIRAGEVLREPSVSRPELVVTGAPVDVVYHDDGVSLKLHGIAIGSGAKGDEVYVKLDNRRRLRGIVDGVNTVRVM